MQGVKKSVGTQRVRAVSSGWRVQTPEMEPLGRLGYNCVRGGICPGCGGSPIHWAQVLVHLHPLLTRNGLSPPWAAVCPVFVRGPSATSSQGLSSPVSLRLPKNKTILSIRPGAPHGLEFIPGLLGHRSWGQGMPKPVPRFVIDPPEEAASLQPWPCPRKGSPWPPHRPHLY